MLEYVRGSRFTDVWLLFFLVRVHMWDLSGSAEYMDVRNELYNGTDAIFIVYDVTNATSFEALDSWIREANRFTTGSPDIFIVGNKVSGEQRLVCVCVCVCVCVLVQEYDCM